MTAEWSYSITMARDLAGATTRTTSPLFSLAGKITSSGYLDAHDSEIRRHPRARGVRGAGASRRGAGPLRRRVHQGLRRLPGRVLLRVVRPPALPGHARGRQGGRGPLDHSRRATADG